jgi:hypothetical protein
MRKFYLYLFLLLPCIGSATIPTLSPSAQVSLVTFAPGNELHAAFGHAVIWVNDPDQGIDRAYSYGTFDFNTENFYLKFLRGTLPYSISFNSLNDLVYYYSEIEHRGIQIQHLNLTDQQKIKIFSALEINLLPENKNYQYKFFYDNCSSRLRDMIANVAPGAFDWKDYDSLKGKSYRDWMNDYLKINSWVTFGMNLALGVPANHVATASESCYLPDNLNLSVKMAQVNGQKLADAPFDVYKSKPLRPDSFDWLGPIPLLVLINLLIAFISIKNRKVELFIFDVILFSLLGILAWFIFFLAVGTDHEVMAYNPSSLLLFPLNVPAVIWFARKNRSIYWTYYCRLAFILTCIGAIWTLFYFPWIALVGLMPLIRLFFLSHFIKYSHD